MRIRRLHGTARRTLTHISRHRRADRHRHTPKHRVHRGSQPPDRPSCRWDRAGAHPIQPAREPFLRIGSRSRRCRQRRGSQHAAVAVIGELVEAGIGHDDRRIAEFVCQSAQSDIEDSVGIGGTGPLGILVPPPSGHRRASGHRRRLPPLPPLRTAANRGCAGKRLAWN